MQLRTHSSSSSIANSGTMGASTWSSSSTPLSSSLTPSADSSSSGSSQTLSSSSSAPTMTSGFTSSFTIPPTPLTSTSLSSSPPAMSTSTSAVVSTSAPPNSSLSADPSSSSHTAFASSSFPVSSTITPFPTTLIISTTEVDQYSTCASAPWTSTLTLTSVLSGHPTTAWTTSTNGVLSTAIVNTNGNRLSRSPGSIAGLILGILGAIAFAVLWLFCARRRQRKLSREASAIPPWAPGGPLEAEVDMEERYGGIIAALNEGMGAGRNAQLEGDTSGEVSGELVPARDSCATLPSYSLRGEDNDGLHVFPLSPPPSAYSAPPPPSAYIPHAANGSRRRSSPGPDASAWFGGYSVAPAPSAASHYSHSSMQYLTRTETGTRTRTGSEEPLLTRAGSGSSYFDSGNKVRLGSAFGSPEGSMNGHNLSPTSHSSGMLSATTSFDVLRSISSQGALQSTSSHGFGFGSTSSGTGSHQGPALGLAISAAPISYKSGRLTRWKKGKRESTGSSTTVSISLSGSVDERPAGVRGFLDRLRRGNTPSPKTDSSRELPRDVESEGAAEKMNAHDPNIFSAFVSPATPEPAPMPTSPRFVLSNPDPWLSSPYVHADVAEHEDNLQPPSWPWLTVPATFSPAPTDESRLAMADGLLDPRLRDSVEGRSNSSLRDFEDYSRPIGGLTIHGIARP
ncbi:uncharacterized protein EDB93DRAFT_113143 [Suillus bovinus]|uniref:uncharacterized protein n=1 Tax=Suillus bovinus TaxID=48563 RepID=UPI001B8819E5|nr:uncharacterized protein EDB93DRAFT_113143 [Suillus bovinus]KAG2129649.1 hypothetical protein EDB93DRAFT_113143 [Suillus bovinus]